MRNFTAFKKSTTILFLSLILFFTITSISCADTPTDSLNKDSGKYLSFYEKVDGETIHWEANFMGDEITSIYKNGKKIPDDLLADYKDKVYDQLDEMRFGGNRYSFNMPVVVGKDFNIDMDELNKELEEMQKNLPNLEENFKMYQFDNEEFKKQMEELKKQLHAYRGRGLFARAGRRAIEHWRSRIGRKAPAASIGHQPCWRQRARRAVGAASPRGIAATHRRARPGCRDGAPRIRADRPGPKLVRAAGAALSRARARRPGTRRASGRGGLLPTGSGNQPEMAIALGRGEGARSLGTDSGQRAAVRRSARDLYSTGRGPGD